jgi:hypothetical protein
MSKIITLVNSNCVTASDNKMTSASALKRKRGQTEVLDAPQKTQSVKEISISATLPDFSQTGWDAAFGAAKTTEDRVAIINGDDSDSRSPASSPEPVEYEEYVERARERRVAMEAMVKESDWKVSEPVGGRMVALDPIFTEEEK